MKIRAFAIGALAFCSAAAFCQVPVELNITSEDSVGLRLSYELKEALQRSSTMRASTAAPRMQATIVTLDPDVKMPDYKGIRTIYSISTIFVGQDNLRYFLTSSVGMCGINQVEVCAKNLLSIVSSESDSFSPLWKKGQK